ncbi:MAG: hypothetical protein HY319_29020 [Armatimonadetes bacterium]|nr:hypothetical protein [Armatimonadota bacterium]
MFGFLRLKSCGLTPGDRLLYRAHFCAVCHAMAEFGGRWTSLLTNYDVTFWLILQSALESEDPPEVERASCTALPPRRVRVQPLSPRARRALAALNLVLVDSKLEDDEVDGEAWKAGLARRALKSPTGRARQTLEELGFPLAALTGLSARQNALESRGERCLESLAEPSASAMGEVFAFIATLCRRPEHEPALRCLGGSLGRYLYLWDALCDREADLRKGRFNALGGVYDPACLRRVLQRLLSEVGQVLDSLPLRDRAPIARQLLGSLRSRLSRELPGPELWPCVPGRRSTAGENVRTTDCDCNDCSGCDCGGCEGCGGDGCNLGECCGCGGGDERKCGCSCCDCCDCCDCCCWVDLSRRPRPRSRLREFFQCFGRSSPAPWHQPKPWHCLCCDSANEEGSTVCKACGASRPPGG